jgi:hypothetical protein
VVLPRWLINKRRVSYPNPNLLQTFYCQIKLRLRDYISTVEKEEPLSPGFPWEYSTQPRQRRGNLTRWSKVDGNFKRM